ncbi:hypothetical protein J2X65_001738 [Ancylobacter sp. 3268]|uniref:hypothetical protein n=1 Tax=Ancylobacter sp. 3268 TaxID=2817752 RepID=UPI0028638866|nr:hypothetical protein [Ancylobacter sp. 3268]MDR6952383.1 hypothetical protein [Ancylobacter sp. 3268]
MSSINNDLPSSADPLVAKHQPDAYRGAIDGAVKAVEEAASFIKDRTERALQSSNDAVSSRLSPVQGLLLGGVAGFVLGVWWGAQHQD